MPETLVHGRYSIRSTLGGGGMARVYLAHDEVLGRDVALKVLRDQYAEDADFAERFKREAQSVASLSHPNIVSVYDRGVAEDGTSYIAMEHVSGGSLKERISQEGVLDAGSAIEVALQITEALEAAHGRGVIHRDVKPHNVLLTSAGDVKVADFGIARAAAVTSTISHTSLVLGTASYMSPEQALGEPVDPRSDLYSLGVVLYEMLTGELPYVADNPVAVSMKHVNEQLRPPKEINPEIPEGLNAVVTKLLAKTPDDRYVGATELAEDLRRVRDGRPPLATGPVAADDEPTRVATRRTRPLPPPTLARRRRRGSTPWVLAAILLLLALLGGLGWTLSQNGGNAGSSVEVPSVEGMSQEQARQELRSAGLRSGIEQQESSEEQDGTVLDQSPNGGSRAEEGALVTLQVGSGPPEPSDVAVPEVTNMSLADARAVLGEAGLTVGNVRWDTSETVPEGVVFEQGYAPGDTVPPGTAVNLGISSGPPPAPAQPQQQQQPQRPSQQPQQSGDQQEQQQDLNEELQDRADERLQEALENMEDQQDGNGGNGERNNGDN